MFVLGKELHCAFPFWGTPSMMGVHDIWSYLHRAPLGRQRISHTVEHFEGALRNVPLCLRTRVSSTTCLSTPNMHYLQHAPTKPRILGTATSKNCRVFSLKEVTDFVHRGLLQNALFEIWVWCYNRQNKVCPSVLTSVHS